MTAFLAEFVRNHGWHVVAEIAFLVLVTVFTGFFVVALFRGRVRAAECPACGRIAARARRACPRCHAPLEPAGF